MPEATPSAAPHSQPTLPPKLLVPAALILISIFVLVLFPWENVANRLRYELARSSGSRIELAGMGPAWTARGPVLAAHDVLIEHPSVDRLRISRLEVGPRWSTGWLTGEPLLRVWAESDLAGIDGELRLGEAPAFVGRVSDVRIESLPLRLEASGIGFSGRLSADAEVSLDPRGIVTGRVTLESPGLRVRSGLLPVEIPFQSASGVIEMLDSGATRIEALRLEGTLVEGDVAGEIAMAHRSQSPPVDLEVRLRILDPNLRSLAPTAGLDLSPSGEAAVRVRGTLDRPQFRPLPGGRGR